MKKLLVCLLAVLILGTALGFAMWHITRSTQRTAIREVLAEREKARELIQNQNFVVVVQPGDTLQVIADEMGITVPAVRSSNKLPLFGRIRVGQKLINPQAYKEAFADYRTALDKIDPSACPKDFQDAWMGYVGAWDLRDDPFVRKENAIDEAPTKVAAHLGASEGLNNGVQIGGDIERPNLHEAADRLEQLDNNEAWLKCQHVALSYGVFVPSE